MKIQLSKALFSILALAGLASAQAQSVTVNPIPVVNDDWRVSASINGWGSASSATLTEGRRSVTSTNSISQNLSDATAGALFSAEAHKGDWGMMADLVYWSLKDGSSSRTAYTPNGDGTISVGDNAATTQTALTGAATYTAYKSASLYLDGLLGLRYISSTTVINSQAIVNIDGTTTADRNRSRSSDLHTTDAIVGFKGRYRIADTSWFIPFDADGGKGPGSNDTTWQLQAGVGDAFSWGDVTLTYRALGFVLPDNHGGTNYTSSGPQLAATINF